MALPPSFLDDLRARIPIAQVVARSVRIQRRGRQWTGCCPFHDERTPSFHVYDDHFHCFGCGAHGDAIGFVMRAQGVGFRDAVDQLAAEAGLEVPRETPHAAAAAVRARDLHDVLEATVAVCRRRLLLPEGGPALAYLRGRGLSDATIEAWGIGWSGPGRGALAADLAREGIAPERLVDAGLVKPAEGREGFVDYFFDRVMFPIRDRRGRVISFGGRRLDDGHPKYVNGPETEVFAKRRTLYGIDRARAAPGRIVVEGYMDVIALDQAGIPGAVAPLGTALTVEHIEGLWRACAAPVLCFDGDAAGARAALRTAEAALPAMTPSRTLRLMALPPGDDPDTLVRREGADGFVRRIEAARPLSDVLFDLLADGHDLAAAETRAALRTRLVDLAGTVRDRALAGELRATLLDRFFARTRSRPRGGASTDAPGRAPRPTPLARPGERARALVGILAREPDLLAELGADLEGLVLPSPWGGLLDAVRAWARGTNGRDPDALRTHLQGVGMGETLARALAGAPFPAPAATLK